MTRRFLRHSAWNFLTILRDPALISAAIDKAAEFQQTPVLTASSFLPALTLASTWIMASRGTARVIRGGYPNGGPRPLHQAYNCLQGCAEYKHDPPPHRDQKDEVLLHHHRRNGENNREQRDEKRACQQQNAALEASILGPAAGGEKSSQDQKYEERRGIADGGAIEQRVKILQQEIGDPFRLVPKDGLENEFWIVDQKIEERLSCVCFARAHRQV